MIEQSILLHIQQSIYFTSSCGQSICNLNLMPHPIILAFSVSQQPPHLGTSFPLFHGCTGMYCVNKQMIGRWSEKRIYPPCSGLRLARSVWCHLWSSLVLSRRSCKRWPSGVWGAGVHLSGICSTLLFVAYFLLQNKTSHLFWYLSNLSIHLQYCCFLRETVETLVVKT